ncbi:MFS transporter [Streptococcus sp. sy018]|uniref:MFS transporter n=1 Tax=Streptococcus sp. sy018 TaxID=2600147 RepID=UPI0011B74069|nr:MFS transporter [Streptococcus sp. sy018]TWS94071.1 MFS transporter [Streptococcus sp. sy018]
MTLRVRLPLFFTVLFTQFGSAVLTFFLSLTVLMQTKSPLAFSQIVLIGSVVSLLGTPVIGLMVDRYPKKPLLLMAQLISMLILAMCFFFSMNQVTPNFFIVILIVVLLNLMDSLVSTTILASAVHLVELEEELGQFNGLIQSVDSASSLLGPVVAGAIYPLISLDMVIGLELLLEGLGLISLCFLSFSNRPFQQLDDDMVDGNAKEEQTLKAALSYLFDQKVLLILLFGMLVMNFLLSALVIGFPIIVTTYFSENSLAVGILEASVSIGMLLASSVFAYRSINPDKISLIIKSWLVSGFCLFAIVFGVTIFKHNLFFLLIFLVVINLMIGLALTAGRIPILTLFQKQIAPSKQGRIFAILDVLVQVSVPVGTLIFGLLFEYFPILTVFFVSGFLMLVFVAYLNRFLKKKDLL